MPPGEPTAPDLELDLSRYEVRRGGRPARLEKLPMELLILFSERQGHLVTRAEILERLWGKQVFVKADAAINTAVRKVRRALGDDPEVPRFLETVVGKGYRFVGPIVVIPRAAAPPALPGGTATVERAGGGGGSSRDSRSLKSVDAEAHRLYLRGRYLSNERTVAALERAIACFQEAIARDPRYALAYCGLADAHAATASPYNKRVAPREAFTRAKAAALRALEIDAELSEAHASLGQVLLQYDWQWAEAEREFGRALELEPGNGLALHWRSHCFLARGRFDDSHRDTLRALDTDPVSVVLNIHLGEHYHLARQQELAIEQYRKTLELNPNHPNARPLLALAYEAGGMYAQAIAELETAAAFWTGTSRVRGPLGRLYGRVGRRTEAERLLRELQRDRAGPRYIAADDIAAVHVGLGEADQAFEWLRQACEERAAALLNLKVEPSFDDLRADRRFADLLRSVGLS
jgi:DNA-binding winged helix-turn-helix (wHTH) protein/Tfp pilus assembly protein PilF